MLTSSIIGDLARSMNFPLFVKHNLFVPDNNKRISHRKRNAAGFSSSMQPLSEYIRYECFRKRIPCIYDFPVFINKPYYLLLWLWLGKYRHYPIELRDNSGIIIHLPAELLPCCRFRE